MLSAQTDGLAQRVDENFAVGTGAQMLADLSADRSREVVIKIGGEVLQYLETLRFRMAMMLVPLST